MNSNILKSTFLFSFFIFISYCSSVPIFNNAFGFQMYSKMIDDEENDPITGNIVFSSLSIYNVLNMVLAGAGLSSTTYSQLVKALQQDLPTFNEQEIHSGIESLSKTLEKNDVTAIAQGIFVQNGYTVDSAYFSLLQEYYESESMSVQFEEPGRSIINDWVSEKTKELIPELIPEGVLSSDTFCVLVNAIYFKNTWANQFDAKDTKPHQFALLDESLVFGSYGVDMMETTSRFFTAIHKKNGVEFKSLTLQYQNENEEKVEYEMLLLLPEKNTRDGMRELEDLMIGMEAEFMDYVVGEQADQFDYDAEVHVKLPKFMIEYKSELKEYLQALGVVDMFIPFAADLSRITEEEDLFVSKVIHQAKIIIDEEGTEAAAATAAVIEFTSMPVRKPEKRIFWCHRPFLFFLVHKESKTILFQGKVLKPLPTGDQDKSKWVRIDSYLVMDKKYQPLLLLLIPFMGLVCCVALAIAVWVLSYRIYKSKRVGGESYNIKLKLESGSEESNEGNEGEEEEVESKLIEVGKETLQNDEIET